MSQTTKNGKGHLNAILVPGALALSAALLALLCYRNIFHYFFTAGDALTQIETSRIQSVKDIFRILSEPMMNNTKLLQIIQMYRPTAIFSYSIDYFLWGLNPVGYHITDVVLHAMVSALAFLFLRRLTGSSLMAWLGAVLFAIHPVHVENVPAVARRHDAVALLFMLPSFLLFMKNYESASPTRKVSILSLAAFALALGAKEIAPILPVLVVTYVGLRTLPVGRTRTAFTKWVVGAVRPAIPYFVLTFVYVGWRTYVLGGLGGEVAERYKNSGIPAMYMGGLLDPYGFVTSRVSQPVVAAFWLLVAFWAYWRFMRKPVGDVPAPNPAATTRPLVFLVVWMLLPLAILVFTGSFAIRRIYVSVIPVTAMLAIAGVDALRATLAATSRIRRWRAAAITAAAGGLVFISTALVGAGFFWYSPLLKPYPQWGEVSTISRAFLYQLSDIVPDLPTDAVINVHDLPQRFMQSAHMRPAVRTPAPLQDYSVKSWIDLNFPGNHMDVVLHTRPNIELVPDDISLVAQTGEGNAVELYVRVKFSDKIEKPVDHRDLGKSYMDIGDFDKAIEHLERYVEIVPDGHLGWALLGEAYREWGDLATAEKDLQKSLALNADDNFPAYFNITKLLRDERRYDEAEAMCIQWAKKMPRYAGDAYRGLGWSYSGRKAYRTAVEYFLRSLDKEQSAHTYWGLTLAYVDGLGDYKNGKKYARKWVRYDNRDANGYLMLGLSQYYSGEVGKAIRNLEKSLEFSQRRSGARYRAFQALGDAKVKKGDIKGGIDVYESAVVAFPDSVDVYTRLAHSYAVMGRCGKANEWLQNAVSKGLGRTQQAGIRAEIGACETKQQRR